MCRAMMNSGGSRILRRNWLPPILNIRLSNKNYSFTSTYSHYQRVYILPVYVDITPTNWNFPWRTWGLWIWAHTESPHPPPIRTSHGGLWDFRSELTQNTSLSPRIGTSHGGLCVVEWCVETTACTAVSCLLASLYEPYLSPKRFSWWPLVSK